MAPPPWCLREGVAGVDGVAEALFFADFGEEAGAHAAGEDAHGGLDKDGIGVVFGEGVVGEADLDLVGFLGEVEVAPRGGGGRGSLVGAPADQSFEGTAGRRRGVRGQSNMPAMARMGALGGEAGFGVGAGGVGGELFEVFAFAGGGAAVGEGIVAFAEEEGEFVGGFVFDGIELLECEVFGGVEAVVGEVGGADDVGVDGEDGEEVFAEEGGGEAEEDIFGGRGALDAEAVRGIR